MPNGSMIIGWVRTVIAVLAPLLAVASEANAQIVVGDSNVGYIDSAVLANQLRLRFDAAYSSQFADRAEFFYAQYGVAGAPQLERGLDGHQELSAYLEWKPLEHVSFFTEIPFRWIDPIVNDNTGGLYDAQLGIKALLLESDRSLLTAQLRGYFPTGDASNGLSTNHYSLEPALLGLFKRSDRLTVESELRYWIPIDGSTAIPVGGATPQDFSGEVLRYGIGAGYRFHQGDCANVSAVTEVVGWHVLGGLRSVGAQRVSARNDAITNFKAGLRFALKRCGRRCQAPSSLFVGYGTVLTDSNWYSDILRLELRHTF
ncbi:MAG: hypothetical protein AAGA03_03340 [Planctomycetota bacterium]